MLKQTTTLLIAIFALFILAACSPAASPVGGIDSLIEEGILMGPGTALPQARPNLTQAVRDSFYQQASFAVTVQFPYHDTVPLSFERERMGLDNERIRTILHEYGQFSGIISDTIYFSPWGAWGFVEEGDFLAELTFDIPQSILIDIIEMELERDLFEASFAEERQRRLQDIENMRIALEFAPEGEWELIALRLELAELQLQQILVNAGNTRANLDYRMEVIRTPIATERLYAPKTGQIMIWHSNLDRPRPFREIPLARPGYMIGTASGTVRITGDHAARVILAISNRGNFYLYASAPLHALRYGDIVPLVHSGTDAYFYAMVATDPMTFDIWREGNHQVLLTPLEGELEGFFDEIGANPYDWQQIMWGISGLLAQPTIPLISDGVLVDARAVVTENLRHYVTIYNDGNLSKRYVTLGLRTGFYPGAQIQILTGLEAGQWVVIP